MENKNERTESHKYTAEFWMLSRAHEYQKTKAERDINNLCIEWCKMRMKSVNLKRECI